MNSAYRPKNSYGMPAMYLELTDVTNYTISSDSKVSISGIADGLYDELAVYTYCVGTSGQNVITNGNSIISINTDSTGTPLIMTGSGCNTYQNQTAYGKSITTHNPNSRYYYNIYSIRNKVKAGTATNAEKFLLWSIVQYAYNNTETFKSYFYNTYSNGTLSNSRIQNGTLDMTGLSYYPFNHTSDWIFNGTTTLVFRNEQIEAGENLTGGDGLSRTTSGTDSAHTQHYMMHCGLFRDLYKANTKITLKTQNLTLKGSVGIYNGGSGFLVSGTLGGDTSKTTTLQPNDDSKNYMMNLDGAYVTGASSADYAPLLINNVGKNTTIHLYGVKTIDSTSVYSANQATASWYAATSLIGKVGASDGTSTGINLDFSKIVLDSRKTHGNLTTDTALDTAYSTTRSIFKRATLLHYFIYNDGCGGTYNYTYSEDWGSTPHQVTYGQEVKYTFDNNDDYPNYSSSQQKRYSGDTTHFTDPTTNSNPTGVFEFATDKFLPYVGDYDKTLQSGQTLSSTTHDTKYHELDVNLAIASLNVGCGTYNDPYVISEAGQLLALAKILKGDTIDTKFVVNLPNDNTALTNDTGDRNLHWCEGDSDHYSYSPLDSNYYYKDASSSATSKYTPIQVRKYLAGAYYQITTDLTLSDKFAGIGVGDASNSGAFAFHGVIVGKVGSLPKLDGTEGTETRYPVITNKSASPLIVASNGSVVKNITVNVLNVSKNISQDSPSTATFEYNAGCASYGAVIGKIMGGDNIIDNVPVTFTNTVFTLGDGAQVVPIGGYVGVIVNGGLFFRNMSDDISGLASSSSSTTLASGVSFGSATGVLSSRQYLYINPIIGRVINGYAVTENGSSYIPAEANVTMKNGTKNYSITDIMNTDAVTIGNDSITADSAQDLFILSLIVNSGTGSKTSALSYDKDTFKTTHIGTYADVGCKQNKVTTSGQANTVCDYALFASNYLELTDSSATPYITVQYTTSSANAQTLTDSGNSYAIALSSSSYTLPDGYRGIGGFNAGNSAYQLGVSGFNSGGSAVTVNLNMSYNTYEQTYDNYFTVGTSGFGLFNTFVPANNCTAEKLTLSGQVKVTAYDSTSGNEYVLTAENRGNYLSAGLLAGIKSNDNSISLDTLNVNTTGSGVYSRQNAGGFIGTVSGTGTVTVNNCTGTNLIIHSNGHSGGFFGSTASPIRVNAESGSSAVSVYAITQDNGTDSWTANSAGGILGSETNSIIKNVIVSQATGGTGITLSSSKGSAGGIIGYSSPAVATNHIDTCNVNDLIIEGRRTGGVVGQFNEGGNRAVSIIGVNVNGDYSSSGTKARVERKTDGNVGTIVGYVQKTNLTIQNCNSKNYIIKSDGSTTSTGGCVGYADANGVIRLKNYLIDGCQFQSSSQHTGGIIGGLGGSGSQVLGYNIAMNSITKTNKYAADFVGTYSNKTLKIVGFSRNNTPSVSTSSDNTAICSNAVCVSGTTQTELHSGSYIIFSDYNGIGYAGDLNTTKPLVTDNTDADIASIITLDSPYVTVNPSLVIDTNTKLTGDGIASTANDLAINDILSGISGSASKAYTYASENGATFDVSRPAW